MHAEAGGRMPMNNAIIIIVLALLIAFAVWKTWRKARRGGGCCGDIQAADARVSVRDRNKAHYPYTVDIAIGGMTCENCARKVENALNLLDGTWAVVSISGGSAKVLSKTPLDEAALREAVRGAGYVVTGCRSIEG